MDSNAILAKYLPWTVRREKERQRIAALRERDGDDCRRCRRPLRFDLPHGHDLGAKIEAIAAEADSEGGELDRLLLTHRRCNPARVDHTGEVLERIRRKAEAELLDKPRRRRRA
jgi:hypothetical protein